MRLDTCDIVDHDDAMCAAVVGRGDGAKTLLSCCVPDLELDCFAIELKCADFLSDAREWKASEVTGKATEEEGRENDCRKVNRVSQTIWFTSISHFRGPSMRMCFLLNEHEYTACCRQLIFASQVMRYYAPAKIHYT